jgi:pantoate--beta-alanine ligase
MKTETTIQGLSASLNPARTARKSIGFIPTMGNLHQGHLNLVREAKKLCDVVVVSIFVNPIQFGPNEDFDSYPRTLEQDQRLLAEVGCDIVFAPSVEQMYGNSPRLTNITVSDITNDLCGLQRPGHFDGVAVVVTKLFNIVQPNFAFFGEKDYQQLAVIRQFVHDLNMPLEVISKSKSKVRSPQWRKRTRPDSCSKRCSSSSKANGAKFVLSCTTAFK